MHGCSGGTAYEVVRKRLLVGKGSSQITVQELNNGTVLNN